MVPRSRKRKLDDEGSDEAYATFSTDGGTNIMNAVQPTELFHDQLMGSFDSKEQRTNLGSSATFKTKTLTKFVSTVENKDPEEHLSKRQRKLAKIREVGEVGSNEKAKGRIQETTAGSLYWFSTAENEWKAAVFHQTLRSRLIAESAKNGKYDYPRACGVNPDDVTAFHPDHKAWGPEIANWPKILFQIQRNEGITTKRDFQNWVEDGRVVLDANNNPVKVYASLPKTISSEIEGYEIEALLRSDWRITKYDICARMPHSWPIRKTKNDTTTPQELCKPNPNAINMRAIRFREKYALLSWNKRFGTDVKNNYLKALYPKHCIDKNSSEGFQINLTTTDIEEMKQPNKGQFSHLKGGKKVREDLQENEEEGTKSTDFENFNEYLNTLHGKAHRKRNSELLAGHNDTTNSQAAIRKEKRNTRKRPHTEIQEAAIVQYVEKRRCIDPVQIEKRLLPATASESAAASRAIPHMEGEDVEAWQRLDSNNGSCNTEANIFLAYGSTIGEKLACGRLTHLTKATSPYQRFPDAGYGSFQGDGSHSAQGLFSPHADNVNLATNTRTLETGRYGPCSFEKHTDQRNNRGGLIGMNEAFSTPPDDIHRNLDHGLSSIGPHSAGFSFNGYGTSGYAAIYSGSNRHGVDSYTSSGSSLNGYTPNSNSFHGNGINGYPTKGNPANAYTLGTCTTNVHTTNAPTTDRQSTNACLNHSQLPDVHIANEARIRRQYINQHATAKDNHVTQFGSAWDCVTASTTNIPINTPSTASSAKSPGLQPEPRIEQSNTIAKDSFYTCLNRPSTPSSSSSLQANNETAPLGEGEFDWLGVDIDTFQYPFDF
ncbi:hypothetical protein MMC18_006326 [Xylographa bjoerkii]|nr:hypothetical protein [Xylographa bjoerkii]